MKSRTDSKKGRGIEKSLDISVVNLTHYYSILSTPDFRKQKQHTILTITSRAFVVNVSENG